VAGPSNRFLCNFFYGFTVIQLGLRVQARLPGGKSTRFEGLLNWGLVTFLYKLPSLQFLGFVDRDKKPWKEGRQKRLITLSIDRLRHNNLACLGSLSLYYALSVRSFFWKSSGIVISVNDAVTNLAPHLALRIYGFSSYS
jgi:hypothetical protein